MQSQTAIKSRCNSWTVFSLRARRGRSRHHLSLRRLPPGRYTAVITATGPGATRSRAVTVRFQIVRARH